MIFCEPWITSSSSVTSTGTQFSPVSSRTGLRVGLSALPEQPPAVGLLHLGVPAGLDERLVGVVRTGGRPGAASGRSPSRRRASWADPIPQALEARVAARRRRRVPRLLGAARAGAARCRARSRATRLRERDVVPHVQLRPEHAPRLRAGTRWSGLAGVGELSASPPNSVDLPASRRRRAPTAAPPRAVRPRRSRSDTSPRSGRGAPARAAALGVGPAWSAHHSTTTSRRRPSAAEPVVPDAQGAPAGAHQAVNPVDEADVGRDPSRPAYSSAPACQ